MSRETSGDTPGMSLGELLGLPLAIDLATAGRAFSIGRTKAYALTKAGEFPVPVLRVGNTYRVRRADLLDALGIPDQPVPAAA